MFEIRPIINALFRSKAGAILLLLQIAITVAIVSNAAFIIQDRIAYLQQETGYPEDEVFHFTINTFAEDVNLLQQLEASEQVIREIPGVISANIVLEVPLSGSGSSSSWGMMPIDQSGTEGYRSVRAAYTGGDEKILDTFGLSISEGRIFSPNEVVITDNAAEFPSVVVASRAFVEELFPNEPGLGQTIFIGNNPVQIIGLVEQMKGPWLKDSRPDNFLIFPFVEVSPYQNVMVRTSASDRAQVMAAIEDVLLAEFNQRVIINLHGLDESKAAYNASDLLMMRMLVVLISVLILITALGIFGMTMFNINKRTKQIGTRRALGARKSAIIRYFLIENSLVCLAGLVLGAAGAVYLGSTLMSEFSVPALDYWYVAFTAVFVLVISLLSVLVPANKAANISPSIATRTI